MLLKSDTYNIQSKLAQYCRNGKAEEIEGTLPERLPHYRRLVFNVVKDALENTYPISFKFIDRKIWDEMVHQFFSSHACSDPQLWKMPEEFYHFCREENYSEKYALPYLNDLLFFEWLEVELYMMEDIEYPDFIQSGQWKNRKVAINPEFRLVKLEYPVHIHQPGESIEKKGAYFLLIYREKESGKVQFINISVLHAFLIENFEAAEKTLDEILNDILYIFGINDINLLQSEVAGFLEDLKSRGFVLGALA